MRSSAAAKAADVANSNLREKSRRQRNWQEWQPARQAATAAAAATATTGEYRARLISSPIGRNNTLLLPSFLPSPLRRRCSVMWREGIRGRRRRQSSAVHRPNLAAGKQVLGFPDLAKAKREDAKRRWMPFPFPLPVRPHRHCFALPWYFAR